MQRGDGGFDFKGRTAAVVLLAWTCAGVASAQVVNPGFDQAGGSLTGWTRFNNVGNNVIAAATTPRSGTHVLKVFGGFNGYPNYSGVFQNLPATGGQLWQAAAHVRHNTGDSLVGTGHRLVLKIEFYRVAGAQYGSPDMLSENGIDVLDAGTPTDTWHPCSLLALAPSGTVQARLALVFVQVNNAGGSALVDDVTCAPAAPPQPGNWQLIWSDEFDGSSVNTAKWRVEDLHLNKNNELQYYAPDDVYLQNGRLVLRSQERSYWGFDDRGQWRHFDYTSGLVETIDRFATAYGKIEVRAKLPSTQGIWPAHWMLPDSREWPPEIDIMELLGHEPTRVYMTHHWGNWPNVQSHGGSFTGPNFAQGFHTFSVEWTPQRLDWRVDDVLRFISVQEVPREPFYIILNTAVGGDWPGNPNGSTIFPQYHEIEYVRVYMPADPGPPLQDVIDATAQTATADGVIAPGEYFAVTNGVNAGLFDQIGQGSEVYVDSSSDGRLNLGFDSVTAWPPASAYGVVVYVDSVPGGFASTYELADATTRAARLASGKGMGTQRSDLYFAPGFLPDYAISLEPDFATIWQLHHAAHVAVNGAAEGAATDMFGGQDVRYRVDDGWAGGRVREIELRLAHLGITPGQTLRFVATLLNGDTAFRANEFVGVAPGNAWDAVNPGATPVVLKPGDFVRFTSVTPVVCGPQCAVPGGDGDVDGDCDVDLADLSLLLAGFGTQSGATHEQGDVDFDGDVELDDLAKLLAVFGVQCP